MTAFLNRDILGLLLISLIFLLTTGKPCYAEQATQERLSESVQKEAAFQIAPAEAKHKPEAKRSKQTKLYGAIPYFDSHKKYMDSSGDVWITTWADDDNCYVMSDDCNGWYTAVNSNMAIHKLEGKDPFTLRGTSINGMPDFGTAGSPVPDAQGTWHCWKGTGLTCVDGTLYWAVTRMMYTSFVPAENSSIIMSKDHGLTWTRPMMENYTSPMFSGRRFGAPFFVEYGKDGKACVDNADKYVYAISNDGYWNNGNSLILGRVPRSKIMNLDGKDWQFYKGNGRDGMHDSAWTSDVNKAGLILEDKGKMSMAGVTYIEPLHTYVMIQWYFPHLNDENPEEKWKDYKTGSSVFVFYQAPTPWGPWETFHTTQLLTQANNFPAPYDPCIPSKFISENGKDVMIFCNLRYMTDGYRMVVLPCRFRTVPVENSISFVGVDSETKGLWRGKYGSQGYDIDPWDANKKKPDYATMYFANVDNQIKWMATEKEEYSLQAPYVDPDKKDPQEAPWLAGRITPYRYSKDYLMVDVNYDLTEKRGLSLYLCDYNPNGVLGEAREMRIDACNGDTDAVLDTRTIADFKNGVYLNYKLKGHIKFRITRIKGPDAVISAVFFD